MTIEFVTGDKVKIVGEKGKEYKVVRTNAKDGSILLYGGSKNPNGKQGYRDVKPDKIRKV